MNQTRESDAGMIITQDQLLEIESANNNGKLNIGVQNPLSTMTGAPDYEEDKNENCNN